MTEPHFTLDPATGPRVVDFWPAPLDGMRRFAPPESVHTRDAKARRPQAVPA